MSGAQSRGVTRNRMVIESVSQSFRRHVITIDCDGARQPTDGGTKGGKLCGGVKDAFIDLTEEDQNALSSEKAPRGYRTYERMSERTRTLSVVQSPSEVITLDSDSESESDFEISSGDYLTDEGIEELLRGWSDEEPIFVRGPPSRIGTHPNSLAPLASLPGIHSARFNGTVFKPGMSVELWTGMFVRITHVVDNYQGFFLRGQHFITLESLGDQFPKWQRELCWVVRETTDGTEIPDEDVPFDSVKSIQTIHLTNRRYTTSENSSGYLCRLKRVSVSRTDVIIRYLTPEEADEGFKVPLNVLRWSWRGETRPFGSIDKCSPPTAIDVETGRSLPLSSNNIRQYTFGDSFCGAGGVSCGARGAGLFVKWGFDHSMPPLSTFARNFPDATSELADFDQFMTISSNEVRVDVCHSSPPCQTWSSAHTIPSANDDKNSALIFSAFNLIGKVKPRIHTMEETTGLIERHKDEFNCVVRDIIELGYSIHCKVVNCYDYGVPQRRRRLILIAAGPGEVLPPFPNPTHGPPGSGLLEYRTIASAIADIPLDAQGHDVQEALYRGYHYGHKAPFDGNSLAKTITCGGGEGNYHPSGLRKYTSREYACLQTFPVDYEFHKKAVVKQIGNAVPPMLSQAIYRSVIKSLRKTDEAELRAAQEQGQGQGQGQAGRTVISLL